MTTLAGASFQVGSLLCRQGQDFHPSRCARRQVVRWICFGRSGGCKARAIPLLAAETSALCCYARLSYISLAAMVGRSGSRYACSVTRSNRTGRGRRRGNKTSNARTFPAQCSRKQKVKDQDEQGLRCVSFDFLVAEGARGVTLERS